MTETEEFNPWQEDPKKIRRQANISLTHGCRVKGEEPLFSGHARGKKRFRVVIEPTNLMRAKPINLTYEEIFNRTGLNSSPQDIHFEDFTPAIKPVQLIKRTRIDFYTGRVKSVRFIEGKVLDKKIK